MIPAFRGTTVTSDVSTITHAILDIVGLVFLMKPSVAEKNPKQKTGR
jgi:hypothetical protein